MKEILRIFMHLKEKYMGMAKRIMRKITEEDSIKFLNKMAIVEVIFAQLRLVQLLHERDFIEQKIQCEKKYPTILILELYALTSGWQETEASAQLLEAIVSIRDDVREDVHNLHVEMIRKFFEQSDQIDALKEEIRELKLRK